MQDGKSFAEAGHGRRVLPTLRIQVAGNDDTVHPDDGAVTIGRELPAQIRLGESGISRMHVRIEPIDDCWLLTDAGSRNGTFLDGRPITSVPVDHDLTVHLGNANGVPVRLSLSVVEGAGEADAITVSGSAGALEDTQANTEEATDDNGGRSDPGIARAGAAVAARREELGLSQRKLTDDHIISQSVLVKFERGRHWPRERTRAKIEEYLRWEPGSLARIRAGEPVPEDESTEALTPTVQVAIAIDAAEIALRAIQSRAGMLPRTDDPEFVSAAAVLLAELRRLEATLTNAARSATGRPALALTLGDVRQAYTHVMLEAARAAGATLGQRLYAVRHRCQLTVHEAANAAGVTCRDVTNAEEGKPTSAPAAATLERFIDILNGRDTAS